MNLLALKAATNTALKRAAMDLDMPQNVNWGDLRCISAERYEDSDGIIGYRVNIEEASPEAGTFQQFVMDWLTEHNFPNIEVRTEW